MDEAMGRVVGACRLAGSLGSSLAQIAAVDPFVLLASCEEVALAFIKAAEGLRASLALPPQFDPQDRSGPFLYAQDSSSPMLDLDCTVQEHVGTAESTGQRPSRRRKEKGETRTVRIPALRPGNLDLPPDDGYTWRKYGQKVILGSNFPRSYFRCTHKNFGCNAKRKVQRLDDDPNVYEITYCGEHSCQASPSPLILASIGPLDDEAEGGESMAFFRSFLGQRMAGESSGSADAVPSEHRQAPAAGIIGKEGEGAIADLADAMFNQGSNNGGGGMDAIFTLKLDE